MNDADEKISSTGASPNSAVIEDAIRLCLLAGLAAWCFLIFAPFILPVMWGGIIAVAIFPVFAKLKTLLGGKNILAAAVYGLVALAVLLIPTIMVAESVIETTRELISAYEQRTLVVPAPNETVKEWPIVGVQAYDIWSQAAENLTATVARYETELQNFGKAAIASAGSAGGTVLLSLVSILISAVFMANATGAYSFAVRLFRRLAGDSKGAYYADLTRDTIRSIAQGVLGIALIQAVLSGLGMWFMDVPAWGLWTIIVLVLAIVQLPPFLMLGFVAVYVFSVADTTPATLFTIYAVIVSTSDAWLKPILLGRGLEVPMLVILLGAIGGMLLHGVIGLFTGAVVLALGYEFFMIWLNQGAGAMAGREAKHDRDTPAAAK